MYTYDTVVIGAGLAGLTAACHLAQANQKTLLLSKGMGAVLLSSGAIDVLGFHPPDSKEPVQNPLGQMDAFIADRAEHPYAVLGKDKIESGLNQFLQLVNNGSTLYQGEAKKNWLLPSTIGAIHATCLAPTALTNGDLSQKGRMLIIGFRELRDFYPTLISQNLNEQELGVKVDSLIIDAPAPLTGKMNITPIELARAFEQEKFRSQLVKAIKDAIKGHDRIGFPAVLGLEEHQAVLADLEKQLGRTVFEISTLPPSVPGRRLFDHLKQRFLDAGGRIIIGPEVSDGTMTDGRVEQIQFPSVNRLKTVRAENFILATGGTYGGGIRTDSTGKVWEPVFDLPVEAPADRHHWFAPTFISPKGQPITYVGLQINNRLNPVDGDQNVLAENLYVAGASIAGSNWISGRTGNGVAISTAAAIVNEISQK